MLPPGGCGGWRWRAGDSGDALPPAQESGGPSGLPHPGLRCPRHPALPPPGLRSSCARARNALPAGDSARPPGQPPRRPPAPDGFRLRPRVSSEHRSPGHSSALGVRRPLLPPRGLLDSGERAPSELGPLPEPRGGGGRVSPIEPRTPSQGWGLGMEGPKDRAASGSPFLARGRPPGGPGHQQARTPTSDLRVKGASWDP